MVRTERESERKEWPRATEREQLTSRLEPPLLKGNGTAVCSKHQIVWGERERGGSEREHGEARADCTVKKKWDWGGREAAGDGATSRSVKAFQFGDIGNA